MTVRVLIVDDSNFFRRSLTEMLNADKHIEVVGSAVDGADAIKMAHELKPDVITMDIEMPVMDGITATKKIMAQIPTPILIFSSLSVEGAKATLDALDAGAIDFLSKKFDDNATDRDMAKRLLCARVRVLGARGLLKNGVATSRRYAHRVNASKSLHSSEIDAKLDLNEIKLIAIGTSTGGPVALQSILTAIPADFPLPIIVIQHMPASFTPSFSERLDSLCDIDVKHVNDGDEVLPGTAFIAPGGVQMLISKEGKRMVLKIEEATQSQTYKPSVDVTFSSLANICSSDVLAIVLTGMGSDGREGARLLKQKGATIWAQDEESSVIYGMPMVIANAGLADAVLSLKEISSLLGKKG